MERLQKNVYSIYLCHKADATICLTLVNSMINDDIRDNALVSSTLFLVVRFLHVLLFCQANKSEGIRFNKSLPVF